MNDVVLASAVRTPIGKIRGALSQVRPDDLAAIAVKTAVKRANADPSSIEEVYLGCANQAGRPPAQTPHREECGCCPQEGQGVAFVGGRHAERSRGTLSVAT